MSHQTLRGGLWRSSGEVEEDLPVGNLDVVRDLLDVRDGVEAFWLLSQCGRAGDVYNVCSGQGYSLRDVLSVYKNLTSVEVRERVDLRSYPPDRRNGEDWRLGQAQCLGLVSPAASAAGPQRHPGILARAGVTRLC